MSHNHRLVTSYNIPLDQQKKSFLVKWNVQLVTNCTITTTICNNLYLPDWRDWTHTRLAVGTFITSEAEGRASSRLIMKIFYTWATQPTRPTRFSAPYIFWTIPPIGKWFPQFKSHIQLIVPISLASLNIHRRERDKCRKRPMLAPKIYSELKMLKLRLNFMC